jgi:hypothetical protein
MGGLGNQMFQYALGKRLALKHGVQLKLDVSQLNDKTVAAEFTVRELALDAFKIEAGIASEKELFSYRKGKMGKLAGLLMLPLGMNNLYIRETAFHFKKMILSAPPNAYLDGYWQSENYFADIREQLLKEFSPKVPLAGLNKELAEKMQQENSVSIHVRRGDYLSIAANQSLFEIGDEHYYLKAMERMAEKIKAPKFYVFSDDAEWFREKVKTTHAVEYVSGNSGKNSYADMQLMSLCKHNIIANSSFSWWGAWLNRNDSKIVIAPQKWFKNNARDTRDLVPANWVRL